MIGKLSPAKMPPTIARECRLALGTAQLGMKYGIANREAAPDLRRAIEIVRAAFDSGVRVFDTAQAYGNSEKMLGAAIAELGIANEVGVVSKLDPAADIGDAARLVQKVRESLANLGVPKLAALLLHDERHLDSWGGTLGKTLVDLQEDGLIGKLGASIYDPEFAARAIENSAIGALQVPGGIFDRRMKRLGIFDRAAARGVQIFMRSVFLQGLVFLTPSTLPAHMKFCAPALETLARFCDAHNCAPDAFALGYAERICPAGFLVVGSETAAQVRRNCEMHAAPVVTPELCVAWDEAWPIDDPAMVNPAKWPRAAAISAKLNCTNIA